MSSKCTTNVCLVYYLWLNIFISPVSTVIHNENLFFQGPFTAALMIIILLLLPLLIATYSLSNKFLFILHWSIYIIFWKTNFIHGMGSMVGWVGVIHDCSFRVNVNKQGRKIERKQKDWNNIMSIIIIIIIFMCSYLDIYTERLIWFVCPSLHNVQWSITVSVPMSLLKIPFYEN